MKKGKTGRAKSQEPVPTTDVNGSVKPKAEKPPEVRQQPSKEKLPSSGASSNVSGVKHGHSTEDSDDNRKTAASPAPVFVEPEAIAEAAKGVNPENIENDHFDPYFYQNLVAMRQHDPGRRQKSRNAHSNRDTGDESNVIRVIAKEVHPKGDKLCYINVKQYKFLGAGAFSDVFVGYVSKVSKSGKAASEEQIVAIKKIWPDPSREDRQIGVHRHLDHQNIVKLRYYYVCVHPTTKTTMWTVIMELMPSTVTAEQSRYIEKTKIMPSLYIKLFMYQTFAGLAYLEKIGFMHRDIKPENLLICMKTGILKIGDFGSAKQFKSGSKMSSYQVTRYYRAPELCMKYCYYDPTVDVWAAGCILAELLTNRIIFYGQNNRDQLFKILRICGTPTAAQLKECVPGHRVDDEVVNTNFPPADWLKICRRYNPKTHSVAAEFLQKVLRYERALRLRGNDALQHKYFETLRVKPKPLLPSGNPIPPLVGIDA